MSNQDGESVTMSSIPNDFGQHVCPWWMGYVLASPIRRLVENPKRLLSPWIKSGDTVLDFGSAMGYHTIPAAKLVGPNGKVFAVDIQSRMLSSLRRRADRKKVSNRITTLLATQEDPNLSPLEESVDFAIALNVLHETSAPDRVVASITKSLKLGGKLLVAEPVGHTSRELRDYLFGLASEYGLSKIRDFKIRGCQAAVFENLS